MLYYLETFHAPNGTSIPLRIVKRKYLTLGFFFIYRFLSSTFPAFRSTTTSFVIRCFTQRFSSLKTCVATQITAAGDHFFSDT